MRFISSSMQQCFIRAVMQFLNIATNNQDATDEILRHYGDTRGHVCVPLALSKTYRGVQHTLHEHEDTAQSIFCVFDTIIHAPQHVFFCFAKYYPLVPLKKRGHLG